MRKIQLKDVQKAIKVGKEVLPMVQPYIEQYAPMIIEQVQERLYTRTTEKASRSSLFDQPKLFW